MEKKNDLDLQPDDTMKILRELVADKAGKATIYDELFVLAECESLLEQTGWYLIGLAVEGVKDITSNLNPAYVKEQLTSIGAVRKQTQMALRMGK